MRYDEMPKQNKEVITASDKREKEFEKQVKKEYGIVYKAAKLILIDFIANYGIDGKLTPDNAYKYDRFNKVTTQVIKNLESIQTVRPAKVETYLKNQYIDAYLRNGYAMESKYQTKLAFREPVRNAIDPMSMTSKISLQNNSDMVRIQINNAIKQSIAQGEGIQGTTARVKKALEQNMNDAVRIATTETTTAINDASQNAMWKAADIVPIKKQWLAIIDERTRDRHRQMNGEIAEVSHKFSNGLMYPGDQRGSAKEVINCRCRMREVIEGFNSASEYLKAQGIDPKTIPFDSYEEWAKYRVN